MKRRPTRAMVAKAEREMRAAQVALDRARDAAIDATEHHHAEPVGAILERAPAALRAGYDAAVREVERRRDQAVDRGLAAWDRGSFRWAS